MNKLVLICFKMNPICPMMLCAKFGWKWPSFLYNSSMYLNSLFFCNLPCARIGWYVKILHKNLLYLHKTPELANVDFFTPHVKTCQDTFMKIVLKTRIINTIKNFKCSSGKIFFFKNKLLQNFTLWKRITEQRGVIFYY